MEKRATGQRTHQRSGCSGWGFSALGSHCPLYSAPQRPPARPPKEARAGGGGWEGVFIPPFPASLSRVHPGWLAPPRRPRLLPAGGPPSSPGVLLPGTLPGVPSPLRAQCSGHGETVAFLPDPPHVSTKWFSGSPWLPGSTCLRPEPWLIRGTGSRTQTPNPNAPCPSQTAATSAAFRAGGWAGRRRRQAAAPPGSRLRLRLRSGPTSWHLSSASRFLACTVATAAQASPGHS